jgi:hypothetical protein
MHAAAACLPRTLAPRVAAAAAAAVAAAVQVAVIAWLRPNDPHAQAGAVAVGRADALVESCAVPVPVAAAAAAAPRAAVSTVALSKGRSYQWAVDMRTDPDMANDTFEVGDTLEVTTTWQQELAPGARMNASGVVVVRSGPGISKAKVRTGARALRSPVSRAQTTASCRQWQQHALRCASLTDSTLYTCAHTARTLHTHTHACR